MPVCVFLCVLWCDYRGHFPLSPRGFRDQTWIATFVVKCLYPLIYFAYPLLTFLQIKFKHYVYGYFVCIYVCISHECSACGTTATGTGIAYGNQALVFQKSSQWLLTKQSTLQSLPQLCWWLYIHFLTAHKAQQVLGCMHSWVERNELVTWNSNEV